MTQKIVIFVYDGLTMLDAIGPYEVLHNLANTEVVFVAEKKGEIRADSSMVHLNIKHSIDEIKEADVLIIPGSTIAFLREMKNKKVLQWIREIDKTTSKTCSVCTGSLILAATGLLEGKKATSHWKPMNLLKEYGVVPTRERMVLEGKYISASGVSAGIDMALQLAALLSDDEEAKAIQLIIEYDPKPPFDSGSLNTASARTVKLAEKKMERDAFKETKVADLFRSGRHMIKLKLSRPGEK